MLRTPHLAGGLLLGLLSLSMVVLGRPASPAVQLYNQGVLLQQIDQEQAAVTRLERALNNEPIPQMAQRVTTQLLMIHQRRQDFPAALRAAERWLEIDPASAQARRTLSELNRIDRQGVDEGRP